MELRGTTRKLMAETEQATGCQVVVTVDASLTMMSGVLMATSDRPGHIVRIHPKAPAAVDYYIVYYCGMIQRFFENPPEERFFFGVGEKGRYQFRKCSNVCLASSGWTTLPSSPCASNCSTEL